MKVWELLYNYGMSGLRRGAAVSLSRRLEFKTEMEKDKTTVYLIRHGECAGNKENRIRGCVDFPLNENGVLQAHALAGAMKDKKIDYIYTSPLSRATSTAAILAETLGVPYEAREGFCNIHLGPWENRLKAELAVEEPEKWQTWLNQPEELVIEGGETLDQVRDRALAELNKIIEEHRGANIALIAHRGVLKPLMAGALGVQRPSYWRLHVDTASYSVLTFDGLHGFCLMGLNFTEHLKGLRIIQEFD